MKFFLTLILFINFLFADELFDLSITIEKLNSFNMTIKQDSDIDKVIDEKTKVLTHLQDSIKNSNIKYLDINSTKINFLEERMGANKQRGNTLAVYRDSVELKLINNDMIFNQFVKDIINAREKFFSKNDIKNIIEKFNIDINSDLIKEKDFYEKSKNDRVSPLVLSFNQNYEKLLLNNRTYNDIGNYFNKNIQNIYQKNLIINIFNINNYLYLLDNKIPFFKSINLYLEYYTSMKLERVLLALFLVLFLIYIFKKITYISLKIIEKIINEKHSCSIPLHNFLNQTFHFPIFLIIFIFYIELFFRLSMTNIEYISKIVTFINYIYIILLIYLINKIIDNFIIFYSGNFIDTEAENSKIKTELVNFFVKIFKIFVFIIFVLILIKQMGYNITTIVASLGIGGIAFALAAKDTFGNLFGSFNIMLDDVFSQNDLIETDKYKGVVVEIGIRSTTIRTFDNALVTIPNAKLSEDAIINWSKRKIGRELRFVLTLTYQSKIEDLQKCVYDIEQILLHNDKIADTNMYIDKIMSEKIINKEHYVGIKNKIRVRLNNFSPYSIDILVQCFTKDVDYEKWIVTKEEIMYNIMQIIKDNNLEFAYPTQTLFMTKEKK